MSVIRKFMARVIGFFLGGRSLRQLIRYLLVGFSSFALDYGIFALLYRGFGVMEVVANSVSVFIAFWYNFLLNRWWSFGSEEAMGRQMMQYLLLMLFNMGFSNLFIYITHQWVGLNPMFGKILAMAMIVLWNFVIYKMVIFRRSDV